MRAPAIARVAAALALVALAAFFSAKSFVHGNYAMGDFKDFYCAARVTLDRSDPYAAAPMARCEGRSVVVPAPLPGYAIAAFVPLARLPFGVACGLWLLALTASAIAAILLLARVGCGDPWSIAVALSVILVAVSFPVGELPPIALLGIALAAWASQRRRTVFIGLGVALSMAEPQIGVAVALAAATLERRYALAVGAVAIVLALIALVLLGAAENIAYVRDVLPAQIRAELPAFFQYSLSWVLDRAGVAPDRALLAGRLSWICMLGVTCWFARTSFARATPAIALLAAAAFAVVGAPYLHIGQIALALPAALWIAHSSIRPSWLVTSGVVALGALSLLNEFFAIGTIALAPFIAGWLGVTYGRSLRAGLSCALAAVVVAAACAAVIVHTGFGFAAPHAQPSASNLAQAPWAAFVATHSVTTSWVLWIVKAPVWFGILATASALVWTALVRGPRPFGAKNRTTAR